jgi:hypothetical protein
MIYLNHFPHKFYGVNIGGDVMSEKEIWKTIINANNYEISNLGRVRNKKTRNFLKGALKPSGNRLIVIRYKNNKGKIRLRKLGKLIADHFIKNPYNYKWINYKDGDFYNNTASNIEWIKHYKNYKSNTIITDKGRTCTKCGIFKTWDEFVTDIAGINGKASLCVGCKKLYYEENKESILRQ